jgi:hypothetical protein
MRSFLAIPLFSLSIVASLPAAAQIVELNHLDCRFNEQSQSMECPDVLSGRSAAVAVETPPAQETEKAKAPSAETQTADAGGEPAKGTPEWNAYCADKYRSFDPETGMYKAYSGQMRPCK